jgi:electron transport complex protein RnfC
LRTFFRGIHPKDRKERTAGCALEKMPAPDKLYVNLAQHAGAPAEAVVAVGDSVKCGTLIGRAQGFISANVHSPVSGKVTALVKQPSASGIKTLHVEIENDGLYDEDFLPPLENPAKEDILARVKDAGIAGMGGAAFPLFVKLSPKETIDTLIVNGVECEPYITCDYRIMLERTEEVARGIALVKAASGAANAIIGIEANKAEAAKKLAAVLPPDIKVVLLKTKYPQGAEKQLIYALTRRRVPAGGLPAAVGVTVLNIQTALAVCEAVEKGRPPIMRAVTVSGGGVEHAGNYYVYTGTPYKFIYDNLKGNAEEDAVAKILSGGPMMGMAQSDLSASVVKGTSALLFLTDAEISERPMTQCINCASCHKCCPMNLMPMVFESLYEQGEFASVKAAGVLNCIECGACSYVCPAKRPLVQVIRLTKKTIKEKGI